MAFDTLIRTRGEFCPAPLCSASRHWRFPEVEFQRRERDRQSARLRGHKWTVKTRRQQDRQREQEAVQYHRVVQLAALDLNVQHPDTFCQWNKRHPDLKERDWLAMFWRWQSRFPTLAGLDWLRDGNASPFTLALDLATIVRGTPGRVRAQERLSVPNKQAYAGR